MTALPRRAARLVAAALWVLVLALAPALPASAEEIAARTYKGPAYALDLADPPTGTATQSQVWYHADAWWALLVEPAARTARVFELMPDHSWRPTSGVVNTDTVQVGDALRDGDVVHVVTRRSDDSLAYVRLTFDPAARDYRAAAPTLVTTRGASPPAAIAKDSRGTLWVAFASATRTVVTYSYNGGVTWARTFTLVTRAGAETAEAVGLVAYDDRIGLLWSDQTTGSFEFASHRDGDLPGVWTREQPLAGPVQADNHISLRRVPGERGDTLVAAVRTAPPDLVEPPGTPLVELLIRTPDGRWSTTPVSTNTEGFADPIVQVDEATRTLHVFGSANGSIVTKRASLDDLRFEPGLGDLFILGLQGELVAPTSTKEPASARSGLVVLASDDAAAAYRHAELPLGSDLPPPDPGDVTPPTTPGDLRAAVPSPKSVVLSWSAANDGNRWTPARDSVPVTRYVVLRDGVEVATVTATSAEDRPVIGDGVPEDTSFRYQVQAVDAAGNRSPPAEIDVTLPGTGTGTPTAQIVGTSLLPLAAIAGLFAVRRRWLTHR